MGRAMCWVERRRERRSGDRTQAQLKFVKEVDFEDNLVRQHVRSTTSDSIRSIMSRKAGTRSDVMAIAYLPWRYVFIYATHVQHQGG